MGSSSFSVKYDGKSLGEHSMDVKDLAPALLSLGKAVERANYILNGDAATVNLKIKATNTGSFEILFDLYQSISSQIDGFISGEMISKAETINSLIFGGNGLIGVLVWLKARKIQKIVEKGDIVTIQVEGGSKIEMPLKAMPLLKSEEVRANLKDMIAPLSKKGIETVEITSSDTKAEPIILEKSDQRFFELPEVEEEILVDDERRVAYTVLSPDFEEGNKWRVHDGTNAIWAGFEDYDFIKLVQDKMKSFTKGDTLICDVHMKQYKAKDGSLKTDFTILKVVEHKSAARQLKLV